MANGDIFHSPLPYPQKELTPEAMPSGVQSCSPKQKCQPYLAGFFAGFLAGFFAGFFAGFLAAFLAGALTAFVAAFLAGFLAAFLAGFFAAFFAAIAVSPRVLVVPHNAGKPHTDGPAGMLRAHWFVIDLLLHPLV